MKNTHLVFLFLFATGNSFAQQVTFQKAYGGNEVGWFIQQTTDGGFFISGTTYSFSAGSADVYIIKLDPNGDLLWTKTFGGINGDISWSAEQTSDGGYIITGWTNSFGAGSSDVYLIRTNTNGNTLWTKTFGGVGHDYGRCVKQTNDGGYISKKS